VETGLMAASAVWIAGEAISRILFHPVAYGIRYGRSW